MSAPTVQPTALHGSSPGEWFLLDVRTPGEFSSAYIDGSVLVPLPELQGALATIREQAAGKPIAIVCRTGRRAFEAHRVMQGQGLKDPHVLEGGVVAWKAAGYPLLGQKGPMPLERQVSAASAGMVVTGVALGFLVNPAFFWFAGAVGAAQLLSALSGTCPMGPMLARMPWNASKNASAGS
ncbi:Inner membrane protein YgaP [Planctomycetes bacterium Poly30]|uniref:Inner membrane protein YgaP n=1 Tax=Saltatorellus ferox TaxID=2528018 RepID=A0A518ENU3_9BACT|nr:Inner membrane protein YgaP [Planctomycetes bacterium Poly30]